MIPRGRGSEEVHALSTVESSKVQLFVLQLSKHSTFLATVVHCPLDCAYLGNLSTEVRTSSSQRLSILMLQQIFSNLSKRFSKRAIMANRHNRFVRALRLQQNGSYVRAAQGLIARPVHKFL